MSLKRKKNIKFFTVYNSFSEKEKKEFKKFIKTGLKGTARNYSKILSSLKTNENGIPDLPESGNDRTRWNRLSELSVLADRFLINKSVESNSIENSFALLNEYGKRNLHSFFEHNYKELIKETSTKPVINFDYNLIYKLDRLNIYRQKSISDPEYFIQKFTKTSNLKTGIHLIELLEDLIGIWNKKAAGILNSVTLNEEIFKGINFEKVLSFFSENSDSPDKLYYTIRFLYLIYLSLMDPEESENYIEAKKIFFREFRSISKEKRSVFYNYMTGLILERANRSLPGAMEELFYLISRKLKEGLTGDIMNNELPINKFRDYVYVAINLGKYRWVNNFIKNYGHLLPPEIRKGNILLAKALVLHHNRKYLKCLELLKNINRKDPFTYVDVSVLKLKVLYELKKYDECFNGLKNFKEYLRKDRVIQDHLKIYAKEFCVDFTLLLKLKQNPIKSSFIDLEFRLSKYNLIGKKWIILKMKEINPGISNKIRRSIRG